MLCFDVEGAPNEPLRSYTTEDRRIRRTWWLFTGAFGALGLALALRSIVGGVGTFDWLLLALVAIVGLTAVLSGAAVRDLEARRRMEAESMARLLRGLSRSVSPDAIVGAIAGELASVVDADHVVVARRRQDPRRLEATLVSTRPGIPSATTMLPLSDLSDPAEERNDPERVVGRPRERGTAGAPVPLRVVDGGTFAERIAERVAGRVRDAFGLRHTLASPLIVEGDVVGALVLSRRRDGGWPSATRRLLEEAAVEASVALTRADSFRAAEVRASTDALTGLPNRRYFDEFCGLLARRRRAGDAVGVLMVDIDRFKRLNDTRGHQVGDEILRAVAGAIAGAVREDDVPVRYGGEEFAVLLRNPSRDVAVEIGERVRAAVGGLDLRRHAVPGVSVSVGVAVQEAPDQPIADLVDSADRALYRAKKAGRDRVVAA